MTARPPSPISNSACPICSNGWKPPPITAPAISAGSRTGCRTFCAISKPSTRALPRWPRAAAARAPQPVDSGLIDIVKRELSDIRFSQSETDRHTQDSLEAVHNTLGHVVDRLAMIEGDLRAVRPAPPQLAARPHLHPPPAPRRRRRSRAAAIPRAAMPPQPAAAAARTAESRRRRKRISPPPRANSRPRRRRPPLSPRRCRRGRSAKFWSRMPRRRAPAIEPDLPPDHPLEPGTRPNGRVASPSERIAASESAISEIPAAPREPVSSSSFIAAARRAAQAAAAAPANDKAARAPPRPSAGDKARRQGTLDHHLQDPLAAGRRERGRDRARHLQDGDDAARQRQRAASPPPIENSASRRLRPQSPADNAGRRRRRRRRR